MFYFSLCIYKLYSQKQATQCMQTKAACKPWLHANHGWPTLIPYDVRIISDGLKQAENTQIWWGWVKMGEKWSTNEKWGLIFWGKVQNGIRSMPLYRCFQRANFDTPHGHHEFRMQFWPTIPMWFRTLRSCEVAFRCVCVPQCLWYMRMHQCMTM